MLRALIPALLILAVGTPATAAHPAPGGEARAGVPARLDVPLLDLSSIRRQLRALAQRAPFMSDGERIASWADFSTLAEAVVGRVVGPFTFEELAPVLARATGPTVSAERGVEARDAAAYQMLSLGYSARETADVVTGRISRGALDTARTMIAVGQSRDDAANYLDGQYKLMLALRAPHRRSAPGRGSFRPTQWDALIERYASLHNVEAVVVRAIMEAESAFNPLAQSRAGAIGLMQLMPTTARELGVNPWVPEQNIEGGVRYFSQLLRMFGGLELALVAYNAGPGFAERYARGQTALYGETRDYVARILSRLAGTR